MLHDIVGEAGREVPGDGAGFGLGLRRSLAEDLLRIKPERPCWRSAGDARRSPIWTRAALKRSSNKTRRGCHADEGAMVIDSSAALAILLGETDDELFAFAIRRPYSRHVCGLCIGNQHCDRSAAGPAGGRELDLFLHRGRIDIIPFNAHQLELARHATAATAKDIIALHSTSATAVPMPALRPSGEPLLFKGGDFLHTDLPSVLSPR